MAVAPISIAVLFRPIPSFPIPTTSERGRRAYRHSHPPVKTGGYARATPDGVRKVLQRRDSKSTSASGFG